MRTFNFKSFFLAAVMLLTIGVGQMWADSTVKGGYIYFDELNSGYTGAGDMQFWVGHGSYSCAYSMTQITNTKLWYYSAPSWGDATYFAFTSGCNGWGCAGQKYYDRIGSNTWKSATKESYTLNSGSYYVFKAASTANKAAVGSDSPYGYKGTEYSSLNSTQTFRVQVTTNGGSSYSNPATAPASLSYSSKTFGSATACNTSSSGSITAGGSTVSVNKSAGFTAKTDITYSSMSSDYTFVCWHDGSSSLGTGTSCTYYPTAATTITARFTQNYPSGKVLYLKPNADWKSNGARFAAYFYGATGDTWVDCSRVDESDYWSVTVPDGYRGYVIFCRMNPATATNNFDNAWNQTDDLMYDASHNGVEITGWNNSQNRIAVATATITGTYHYFPGETISLTVTPMGDDGAAKTYQWYKGGTASGNAISGATSATYTKASCTYADAGAYYCKVTWGGNAHWADNSTAYNVKILHLYVNGSRNGDPYGDVDFTKVDGTTATATMDLGLLWTYGFSIGDGCGNYYGNTGTMTESDCTNWTMDVSTQCAMTTTNATNYTFTVNYSNLAAPVVSVTYPKSNQVASKTIYFDNNVLKWANVWYRIGKSNHSSATQMTKVSGTENLYQVTTSKYDNFYSWIIANAQGGTGDNKSIYNTKNTPAITAATNYIGDAVTATITVTPGSSPSTGGTDENNNCSFYGETRTSGMKTDAVTITAPTNGTITVSYTNTSGSAASFTSGSQNLAHTVIITPTATGATGYHLSGLTVNGNAHTSGNTYTVTEATTVAASFAENTYDLTFTHNGHGTIQVGGVTVAANSTAAVNHFTTKTLVATPATGYYFTGWTVSGTNAAAVTIANTSNASTTIKATNTNATVTANFAPIWRIAFADTYGGTSWNTDLYPINNLAANGSGHLVGTVTRSNFDGHPHTSINFKVFNAQANKWYGVNSKGYGPNGATNNGSSGSTIAPNYNAASRCAYLVRNGGSNIAFTTAGCGTYTFTWDTTDYKLTVTYPTTVQINANAYKKDIDNNITQSTIGGSISSIVASCSGTLSSMQYYSGSSETMTVTHSTPTTGYTWVGWYSNSGNPSTQWTAGANVVINNAARTIALTNRSSVTYANGLFQETPTTITLNSTAGGHIERNGVTITSINVGVTTTRTITAVPDAGYYFTGWTKTSGTDYSISSTSTATTTITGGGAGTSGQVLTANFAPAWSVVGSGDISWTVPGTHVIDHIETAGGNTTGYVDITLSARTTYEIKLYDLTAWSEKYVGRADEVTTPITYANSGSANALNTYGGYNFFFRTAGAGTYRFTRNFTTGTLTITYPTAYSVTYNGNGSTGGTLPDTEYYTSGETVTVAAKGDLAKTNYTFDGWNTTANISGTARAAGSTFTISANTNLYAKWTQTVSLDRNNGTTGSESWTAIYNSNALTGYTAPTKTGYTFGGYYTAESSNNGSGTQVINTTSALKTSVTDYTDASGNWISATTRTLYAKWTPKTYTVTLNNQSATTAGTESIKVTYNSTSNLTSAIIVPTKTGYTFAGYYTATGGGGVQIINADGNVLAGVSSYTGTYSSNPKWIYAGNITLYAKWTQNITLNQNGATTNGTTSLAAVYNATLSTAGITNPSKTNYTFAGWTNGSGGSGSVVITAAKAVNTVASWTDSDKKWIHAGTSTLYAKWTENLHTVTVAKDPAAGGTTNVASVTGVGVATASGTITATANPGYYFTGWTIPDGVTLASGTTSSASITINATADSKTITANFAPIWTVAGNMDGWSTTSHKITNITASAGSMVSGYVDITLAANTDYEFKVVNLQTDTWWGSEVSDNVINYVNRATAKDLAANGSGGTNNQKIRTATAGTYRFTWDVSNSEVTVTYPHTAYKISMSFGTEPTVGSFTATNLAANAVGGNITSAVGSVTGALQVDGAHGTQYVKSGETVVFTHSAAASGYTWDKWGSSYVAASRTITPYTAGTYVAIDDAAGTLTLSNITADKSVYSFFKENATTITINTANSNYGDLKIGGAASSWGTSVTLGATTTNTIKGEGKNGYMFTTWALTGAATKASGNLTDQQITIKGNGTASSSGTATASFAPGYVIRGSLYDDSGDGGLAGWDNTTAILVPNLSTGVGTYTATLQRGKRYKFKVYFMEGSGYWRGTSEESDISSGTTYTLPDGGNDITFTAGANGTYTFNYNFSTRALTVNFPTAYSVTYHGNGSTGGSVPTDATPYASGETVNVAGNTGSLAKTNYTLSGWNTTEHITGTNYSHAGGASFTITANTNLYAKWTHSISLDKNGGTGSSTVTATYNSSTLTDWSAPTRTGYTFAGYWTSETSDNGSGTLVINTSGVLQSGVTDYTDASGNWISATARTLYAKWTENSYSVTFYNGGHGTVQVAGATIANGGTATITQVNSKTLAATASTGYDFNGWTKTGGAVIANTSNASTSITATAAGTVTANWTAHSYSISYDLAGGSVATPNPTSYTIESSAITLNNPTRTGYTFAGWTGTDLASATMSVTIAAGSTGDRSYTATWTPNTNTAYTVNHFKQNLDGTYPVSPTETDNLEGTTGASVTPARKSYTGFTAPSGTTVTIAADGSTVVNYNYTRNSYTLTWSTDGDPLTGSYTSGSTKFGASITAPNTPTKTNFVFAAWSPAVAATMPAANTTYTATWTAAVASVTTGGNTTYYATVADAFAAANAATAASTITMLNHASVTTALTYSNTNTQNCTLDLHGYTITSTTSSRYPLQINKAGVTFTITDETVGKAGKLSMTSTQSGSTIFGAWANAGNLVLEAGTIEAISSTQTIAGATAGTNGTFTMNGGTIHVQTSNSKVGYGVHYNGVVTINDGTIHVEADGNACGIKWAEAGTSPSATVNGGKFNISGATAYATDNASNITIKGGWYTTNNNLASRVSAPKHVFDLTGHSPYLYEVAEGYTLTWTTDGDPLTGTYTSGTTKVGTTIVAPNTPTKTGYTFAGWSPTPAATMPSANTEYTATWTINNYTVTIVKNEDAWGSVSATSITSVPYGTAVSTDGSTLTVTGKTPVTATPTAATAQYTYTFNNWTGVPATVTGNVTITANFTRTTNGYTIRFLNYDGEVLQTGTVNYGETPVYSGSTPTKPTDASYTYSFTGWSPAISSVTGAQDYTAQFSSTDNVASVTVSGDTRYFTTIGTAWDYVNEQSSDMTVTILKDITGISSSLAYTPAAAVKCTLNLNNHLVKGASTKLLDVNKSSSTFVITDESVGKGGELYNEPSGEALYYGAYLTEGTLKLLAGKVHAKNTKDDYESLDANAKKCRAYGIYVAKNQTFQMTGGEIEGEAIYVGYGLVNEGYATISGGTIHGKTSKFTTAAGIYSSGTTNIGGGTIKATAYTTIARGLYIAGGTTNINSGDSVIIESKTKSTTAYGIYHTSGTFNAKPDCKLRVSVEAKTNTAYGIFAQRTVNIDGGKFYVTAKGNTAYGILTQRGTTTIQGNPEFTVKATNKAYGVAANGTTPSATTKGYRGTIKVKGGTFNVETTSTTIAYGAYAYAGSGYSQKTTGSSTPKGNYINAGTIEISGGEFNVKAKTNTAYGIYVDQKTQEDASAGDPVTACGKCTVTGNTAKFKVTSTSDATKAYAMNTIAIADSLIVQGGYYSTNRTDETSTSVIEDKYTAPTKTCNYHVFNPTDLPAYPYKVAEGYRLTWNLDGGTVTTAGTGAAVDATGTPSIVVERGGSITAPVVEKEGYTFYQWSPSVVSPMPASDKTYTAQWTGNITITGDVWLTSYKDVKVYTTSTTSNLIRVQCANTQGATGIRIKYLDGSGTEVDKANSHFRLCNNGTSNYNLRDGAYLPLNVAEYDSTFAIRYEPKAFETTETDTLKLQLMNGYTMISEATLTLHGRSLPEEFVIATKGNDNVWYALPNTLEATEAAAKAVAGVRITVNNATNPTEATYAPDITVYKGMNHYASANAYGIRLTNNGTNCLQVSTTNNKNVMWLSSSGSTKCQDWWLQSTDFGAYSVTLPSNTGNTTKKIGIYSGNMGYFSSVTSGPIYFLPITNKIVDKPASVTEWGKKSVILDVDAQTASGAQARIGSGDPEKGSFAQTRTSVKGSATKYNYTLTFSTTDFSTHKGELLYIDWLDGSGNVISTSSVTIPWIIASSGTMSTIDGTKGDWNTEVHVLPGVTLTADGGSFGSSTVVVKQLEIYPGAKVKVTTGTLNVTDLVLRYGWTRAGEKAYDVAELHIKPDPSGANLTTTRAYADWYIDYDQYYSFAVPWNVTVANITYKNSNNAASAGMKLRYYDGNQRATTGQDQIGRNWKEYGVTGNEAMPTTFEPSKGYALTAKRPTGKAFSILRMPLTIPSASWTAGGEHGYISSTHKDQVSVTGWGVDNPDVPWYAKGWNFIGNPYMATFSTSGEGITGHILDAEGKGIRYVTIPDGDFKNYDQINATEATIKPASGFFIQANNEEAQNVTFAAGSIVAASVPALLAKADANPTMPEQDAYIRLSYDGGKDQMGLIIADEFTAEYEFNADLAKMLGDGNFVKTYMHYSDMDLAYVAINGTLAKSWIPVTVTIPENGEYTFSLTNSSIVDELEGVYLIDYGKGSRITNLIERDYVFQAEAGTLTDRFSINAIVSEHKTPTGIEAVGSEIDGEKPVKFIYQDKMYIRYRGIIYDANGKRINK